MDLDVSSIQKELRALQQERAQARDRLAAFTAPRGGGRGGPLLGAGRGGRGGPGRGGPFDNGPRAGSAFSRMASGGMDSGRLGRSGSMNGGSMHDRRGGLGPDMPPGRLGSRLSSRDSMLDRQLSRGSRHEGRGGARGRDEEGELPSITGRKRLLSAVVVDGEAVVAGGTQADAAGGSNDRSSRDHDEPPAKRPALGADPTAAKRNKRMFGALLFGTLQKFRDEDSAFKQSDVAQKRAEIERRAAEKVEAEERRLKEEARKEFQSKREAELSALRELNLKAQEKELELQCARSIAHQQRLHSFCACAPEPARAKSSTKEEGGEAPVRLLWMPAKPSAATDALLEARQAEFEAWKVQALQQLEGDKAALAERLRVAQEQRQARWEAQQAARAAARAGGAGAAAAAEGVQEEEEHAEHEEDAGLLHDDDEGQQHEEQHAGEQPGDGNGGKSSNGPPAENGDGDLADEAAGRHSVEQQEEDDEMAGESDSEAAANPSSVEDLLR